MSLRHIGNGVTVILLLLCLLLAALIFRQWETYSLEPPEADVSQTVEKPKRPDTKLFLGSQGKSIQITQFSEIMARPLFTEGRLPEEEPEPEQALPFQVGVPKLKLEGVVLSPESRVAVIRDLTDNSLLRLSEGMIHGGWRIAKVDEAEVVFTREDETHRIPLELINKPAAKASTSRFRLPSNNKPARARPGAKGP